MKTFFVPQTFLALVVALAVASPVCQAQDQPLPPPASAGVLPAGIPPGSALEQVFKLVQAGLDATVVKTYISNSATTFNLDAEKIIALSDAGVSADIINAMMAHDKNYSAVPPTTESAPANNSVSAPETTPLAAPVTVNYFYNNLSPYGNWVEVEGYGRCWRPTVVMYDSEWRPYCDRGHWVYTDHGWYWDSDYSWGVTFHYGRWFRHDRFGWCWYPDTVWAPSWVTWRSSDAYCGWAPLPPFAEYRPGAGFFYRGASVSVGFDFGLGADYFTFISVNRMCERHPRYYRENHERATQIFSQTTIINNYNVNRQTVVNNGIPVGRINTAVSRPIRTVAVAELPNAARQGWRGETEHSGQRPVNIDSRPNRTGQGQAVAPGTRPNAPAQQSILPGRNSGENTSPRQPVTQPNQNHNNQGERDSGNRGFNSVPPPVTNPQANNNFSGAPFIRQQPRGDAPANNAGQHNSTVTPPAIVRQTDHASVTIPTHTQTQTPVVRQAELPVAGVPQHSQLQPQSGHYSTPVAPATSEHWQQREQARSEPVQPRPVVPETAPRNYPQHQTPAPSVPSQQSGGKDQDKNLPNH